MDRQEKKELALEILKTTAILSTLTVAMIVAPGAVGALGKFIKFFEDEPEKWRYRYQTKRAIKRLENRGLVVVQPKGKEAILKLTQAGKKWLGHHTMTRLTINKPKQWDGVWRVMIFDIPENHREIRNAVRSWLKRLGFARLQKSVWVIPWPCRKHFEILTAEYSLGSQALLIESQAITNEAVLKKTFSLPANPHWQATIVK